ncbi:MAG: beta-galactosidase [Clostridia bacterium]|nr:beta-galactosidase [Clostridia bacterium]
MKFSVAYNAEYYDSTTWDRDLVLVRDAGVKRIRFAEFAWAIMEPEEGRFDFSVIDAVVEKAASYGIDSILCTPTACPPIWLSEGYAIYPESIDGHVSLPGSRQQRCYSSPDYLRFSYRIVEEMAKHFADNPHVVAWQIDNELCGEMKKCYCPRCRANFDKWLKYKYGTIEVLNRRWGTQFWSQTYQCFEQIPTPKHFASDLALWHNPAINLDFVRFSSDNIIRFSDAQYDILRKYTDVPITTNTDDFYFGDTLNLYKLFRRLDVAGIDVYTGDPIKVGFYSDFMRSVKPDVPRFWFLEFSDHPQDPEQLFGVAEQRGAEWMEIYKFRPYPWGQEQSEEAMINRFGRPTEGYYAVQDYVRADRKIAVEEPTAALVYDFDSSWAYHAKSMLFPNDFGPKGNALTYPNYLEHNVYPGMYPHFDAIAIVDDSFDFSAYKLLVAPRHIVWSETFERSILAFVESGGTFLCDTDIFKKNADNAYLEAQPALITDVFGVAPDLPVEDRDFTVPRVVKYGKGTAVMVSRELTAEAWDELIKKYK